MDTLDYIKLAQKNEKEGIKADTKSIKLSIVTNFTDDILKKILLGMCVYEGINAEIYSVSFKQYLFELKNKDSILNKKEDSITFIFFDINPYIDSEFLSDENHIEEVINDIVNFAKNKKSLIVIQTTPTPTTRQHTRVLREHKVNVITEKYNQALKKLKNGHQNIHIVDTDRITRSIGEKKARDMRSLYAFSQPFSSEFFLEIVKEWMTFVRTQSGIVKKCIVVDLDNTLWGGIVGEVGPLGISLGHEYPGNAFLEFQRTLLGFHEQGIILAINSRNNPEDVEEVFQKNKNMILNKNHFAVIVANWNNKAENLRIIAKDLNIGLDSMIFIDDDAMNRDLVKTELPEVLVPNWSIPPEEYANELLNLDAFHSFNITLEDKERGKMYVAEQERKEVMQQTGNMAEYLKNLTVEIDIYKNEKTQIPRLAQLTQKTNQFNLSTIRSSEQEIEDLIENDNLVFSGEIKDRFGSYGITILGIINTTDNHLAELTTFLMSCRVMGRRVEEVFFKNMLSELDKKGIKKLFATFIPSKKNMPIADFLPLIGGIVKTKKKNGEIEYEVIIKDALAKFEKSLIPIKINNLY